MSGMTEEHVFVDASMNALKTARFDRETRTITIRLLPGYEPRELEVLMHGQKVSQERADALFLADKIEEFVRATSPSTAPAR